MDNFILDGSSLTLDQNTNYTNYTNYYDSQSGGDISTTMSDSVNTPEESKKNYPTGGFPPIYECEKKPIVYEASIRKKLELFPNVRTILGEKFKNHT